MIHIAKPLVWAFSLVFMSVRLTLAVDRINLSVTNLTAF